jgi:hypothetical protein
MTSLGDVERALEAIYVAAEGARLRTDDRRKAIEVAAMLEEIERALGWLGRRHPLTIVDAAAGKAYVGVLAAALVFAREGADARVVCLEREPARVDASRAAAARAGCADAVACVAADVGDARAWPSEPSLVVALHACGPASDAIVDAAVTARARMLLMVPCCTSAAVPSAAAAAEAARRLGIPRHAAVRRRFVQAFVDAERTLRLEAAGYETEVVELVPPTVTPHNLLWRARRVGEPGRTQRARDAHRQLVSGADIAKSPTM